MAFCRGCPSRPVKAWQPARISQVLPQSAERGTFAYIHLLSAASFLSGLTFLATTNTITAGWPFAVVALFVLTAAVLTIPIAVVEVVRMKGRGGNSESTEPAEAPEGVAGEGLREAHGESPRPRGATP